MSDEVQEAVPVVEEKKDLGQILLLANSAGLVLLLLLTLFSLALVISLSGDVGRLEDQLRKSAKSAKALEQEVAQLRALLQPPPPPATAAAPAGGPPPVPRNIDAADPSRDCVIRPGSKGGIGNCL